MANTDVSRLLADWNDGDPDALGKLMPLVYNDLRAIAGRYFASEDPDHTLQPTALVNDLYVHLNGRRTVNWKSPAHFFGTAATILRRLLIDHARHRQAACRGGDVPNLPLDGDFALPIRLSVEELLALDEALKKLHKLESRQCQVVELKYFVDLTIKEIAKVLEVKDTTVKKDWRIAKAWLRRELSSEPQP